MTDESPRAMVHEVARAVAYINQQDDFGPMTKATLIAMVRRIADAAIADVESMVGTDEEPAA